MFAKLIGLGLGMIPFCLWKGLDTREPKLYAAMIFSLILSLYGFYKGRLKPYKNIWFLLFIIYIPINYFLSPQINFKILDSQIGTFWLVQAYLVIMIYLIALVAISSYEFSDKDKSLILKVMVWVGTIMSLYGALQYCGFDQFFVGHIPGNFISKNVCGTLGTTCLFSPFIAMIIPIALYLKKYINSILMILMVFLCDSQIGYGAMFVSLIFLIGTKNKKMMIAMFSLFIILSSVLSIGYFKSAKIKSFIGDNGRFKVWSVIMNDIKNPISDDKGNPKRFALTGFGLGSFRYLFHTQHKELIPGEPFFEAHNEYLELFYNTGVIGLGLFLMGIFFIIKQSFPLNRLNAHLLASFICVTVSAGGIFCLQNGAIAFYVLTITGLLNKKEAGKC
jgi:hypothetical protein